MKIGDAQLNPEAVMGTSWGQNDQKKAHTENATAAALHAIPPLRPRENFAGGSVSGA